jgi:prepilin-type N-terminal cleavage/methylation domain-containing protein
MQGRESGFSLAEVMVAIAILVAITWFGMPALHAYTAESSLVARAEVFKGEFRRARSIAIRSNRQTALRFEQRSDGIYVGIYRDGDFDGVLSRDIQRGIDPLVETPVRIGDATRVRVGIAEGVPEPPPGRGMLDPEDPIRFGRSDMISFSPLGTATPGTLYLTGYGLQMAVRVTGTDARIRTMIWRGAGWRNHR